MIEQITYLLFIRRLDELQDLRENRARRMGGAIEDPIFLPGQSHLRWKNLKNASAADAHETMGREVFPFLHQLGGEGSTY